MKLTKRNIDSAEYQGGTDYRWDESLPGFGLRLYPSGRRSFVVNYRVNGRKRIMVLGRYGPMTPDQARRRARKVLVGAADGEDASLERQRSLHSATMRDLAVRYMEDHAHVNKKPKSIEEDERQWHIHILPALRTRKVADITRDDVSRLQRKMADSPVAANRVLALLSKAFNLAEVWGWRPDGSNPCRHVARYKEARRERFLSASEIERLAQVLDEAEAMQRESPAIVAALRLLLLTGCRVGEILKLRWKDVDRERGYLRLPDSKTGARKVYLSQPALQVLDGIERLPENPYVIVGKKAGTHLVNLKDPWRRLRRRADLEDVRLHDLRHTFASYGAAAGLSLPLIGKMLGHSQAATTQRYAHLGDDPVRLAVETVGAGISAALRGVESEEA